MAPDKILQQKNGDNYGDFLCFYSVGLSYCKIIPRYSVSREDMVHIKEIMAVYITSIFSEQEHHPVILINKKSR